jgi:hypothetical protein
VTEDSRGAGMHQDPLPSYEDYIDGTRILRRIDHIHRFSFTVSYQKSGAIATPAAQDALISEGYAVLNDLLETSGVHYLHVLSGEASRSKSESNDDRSEPLLTFTFGHDTKNCQFKFFEDRFRIERGPSSFPEFYDWYRIVMPEALRIEMTLRQIIQRATMRPLRPVMSVHDFVFDFCRFRKPPGVQELEGEDGEEQYTRNMEVLEAIIPRLPDNREMTALTRQQFYRLDLTLSKRETFGDINRNAWYFIEAPFNQNGRFIVFTAQLRNAASEILEDGKVVETFPFDPDFGEDYRLALLDFLRDKALEGFVSQLLGGWRFETERNL